MTDGNTMRFGALAAGTALLVSLIAFIAWFAKAGVMVDFISETVMAGFKCDVALFLPVRSLPSRSRRIHDEDIESLDLPSVCICARQFHSPSTIVNR
jgi:MFS superfamily sulfate permease-like transporter